MPAKFHQLTSTPAVRAARGRYYGSSGPASAAPPRDVLGPEEQEFIRARDSFYLSTVNEDGWPYIQHRGGPPGFLQVLGPTSLGFADLSGNRQLLSTGNLAANDRVALFLMDYPGRTRLKILGHARVEDAREQPELAARVATLPQRQAVERIFRIEVVAFDWNCPKYITPRYTAEQVETVVAALKQRIAALERN